MRFTFKSIFYFFICFSDQLLVIVRRKCPIINIVSDRIAKAIGDRHFTPLAKASLNDRLQASRLDLLNFLIKRLVSSLKH